ncbi:hypothetical protein HELRODRAFT_105422 [Helobdella robusta]|uniref:Peptidase M12B domain-containing protein n=1 Tax=Helobdella robusta TaxID=6412 RepID=T1EDU7_HELRO|nr:hypothetical protein HELRODRAFT_105422 [Helobdella robusta]ESO12596.1 hypothetical protein HELRODRAFT_105422 [Helobdella robusta]
MFSGIIFFLVVFAAGGLQNVAIASPDRVLLSSTDGTPLTTTLTENGGHVQQLTIDLTTSNNENFILDMLLSGHSFSSSYKETVHGESGISYNNFNRSTICYYTGTVRGQSKSHAGVSTCDQKISGFFIVNDKTFTIQPFPNSKFAASVQEASDPVNDFVCGSKGSSNTLRQLSKRSTSLSSLVSLRDKRNRIIEIYLSGDYFFYLALGSTSAAFERMRSIVNAANALYNSVGIYIVLVGSEVWTSPIFRVDIDISVTLTNFYNYKDTYLNANVPSHDTAALVSANGFSSNIIGLGSLGTMCSSTESGVVIKDGGQYNVAFPGAILTHEVGHVLGLVHDNTTCSCSSSACIMKSSISSVNVPTKFSSCSLNDLANNWSKGYDLCLWNIPDINASTSCGNGVVEDGETCDCGGLPSDMCNPSCCNAATCQLFSPYQCASGFCCDLSTCKVYQANTVCRGASDTCDLQELCDGKSAYCPEDTYKHDGTQCAVDGVTAYCSEGRCRTRDTQCAFVWGLGIKSSPDSCYTTANMRGSSMGSCRKTFTSTPTYYPCAASDVLCGQLFCDVSYENGNTQLQDLYTGYFTTAGTTCKYASFNFGTQISDPGYVPNGVTCGNNKMCYNNSCRAVSDILSVTPCSDNCTSNGICNNKGTCQCLNGLKYPECAGNIITIPAPTTTTTSTKKPSNINDAHSLHRPSSFIPIVSFHTSIALPLIFRYCL